MNIAVIGFPGSNEWDSYHAVKDALDQPIEIVPHTAADLSAFDVIIIPGGFSYGDYLRSGAIARLAPVMGAIKEAATQGKIVFGIGNGFQILTEAGLLPGVLQANESLKFKCHPASIEVVNNETAFTSQFAQGETINLPIAHETGNYYCDEKTLRELERGGRVIFRYRDNPNGSVAHIAGICNEEGNVLGMMPRPERAVYDWLGSTDGKRLFGSILDDWRVQHGRKATV